MNKNILKVIIFYLVLTSNFNLYSMTRVPEMDYVGGAIEQGKIKEVSRKIKNWIDNLDERDEGAIAVGCFGLAISVGALLSIFALEK